MKRRQLLFTILKGVALATVCRSSASGQDDIDPVKIMPDTHKLLFENKFVRVIESKIPAGGFEPRHRHPNNVVVFLADYDAEVKTFPNGEWTRIHRSFGTATWNEDTVHEARIVGNAPSHTVRVELKY